MVNVATGSGSSTRGGPSAGSFLSVLAKFVGDPYQFGAAGPSAFDCSGLVQYALSRVGISAPRTSEEQYAWVQHISASQLQPGDLIFEQWPGDGAAPGHVAIYTGSGKIEEAPQPGQPVHIIPWSPGSVSAEGGRVVGYGRIPGMSGGGTATLTSFPGGGLFSWPGDIVGAFSSAGQAIDWLLQPSNWIRIFCGVSGTVAIITGVFMMSHTGGTVGESVMVPRAASLPLGILLVGTGGVLLFIAFHNVPSSVKNINDFVPWLIADLHGKNSTTAAPSSGGGGAGEIA